MNEKQAFTPLCFLYLVQTHLIFFYAIMNQKYPTGCTQYDRTGGTHGARGAPGGQGCQGCQGPDTNKTSTSEPSKVHSFFKTVLCTILRYLLFKLASADVSLKSASIGSNEDCAQHFFKNEWTLSLKKFLHKNSPMSCQQK